MKNLASRAGMFLALAVSGTVLAQSGAPPQSDPGKELFQFERQIEEAMVTGDAAFIRRAAAEDAHFVHAGGLNWTKQDWIQNIATTTRPKAREIDQPQIEMHGNTALTTGRIHVTTETREYTIWYIRAYTRQNGNWVFLSHHTMRSANGPLSALLEH